MKKQDDIASRSAICMFLIMVMLLISALRLITVMNDENLSAAATKQTSYRLTVSRQRGTIFDTNMRSLTNDTTRTVTAVEPTDDGRNTMSRVLEIEQMKQLSEWLSDGKPVLVTTQKEIEGEGVKSITVPVNQNPDSLAVHVIGYTDSSGHGVSGLQRAFDDLLYSESTVDFLYVRDANGDIVGGFETELSGDVRIEASGIKTTIDADIQALVEEAASSLKSGAVIVSEVGTGKIRALASYPSYDVTRVADFLQDDSSPLLNRAFSAYNVGSVFKLCVAAAAMEQGVYGTMLYECTGSKTITDKVFACHKADGHGLLDLKGAITYSCNTFFYTLAENTGATAIYNMASSLGFGQRYVFADGFYTEKGNMPQPSVFGASEQSIANIAIGQGELMLTPVSLLTLYEAIACGGEYRRPTLFEGVVKNGVVIKPAEENPPTRVMTSQTADYLREGLMGVVEIGTGRSAAPVSCKAAGKTATAQTGWISNGKNVDHSWFCGFFPAEDPKYVAVIISENTSGGGTPCGPVFSRIADAIYNLKLS